VNETADVLIIGAGPAGLLLACELRLAGVATTVIERAPARPDFCRGFNLNPRALDLLARRGLAGPLIDEGWRVSVARAACPAHPDLRAILVRADGHTAWHGPAGEQPGPSAQTTDRV
jgi:2-polyprenyl-6-methoxyphenol hydroxylase-like FAD-dependent oxidoreductase